MLTMRSLFQFTLDLFDPPAPADTPPAVLPAAAVPTPGVPHGVAQTLQQAIAPVTFTHPRANRELRLGDAMVGYRFERAKRRTIGFVVGPDGLVVRAPRWTPVVEVEAALRAK